MNKNIRIERREKEGDFIIHKVKFYTMFAPYLQASYGSHMKINNSNGYSIPNCKDIKIFLNQEIYSWRARQYIIMESEYEKMTST